MKRDSVRDKSWQDTQKFIRSGKFWLIQISSFALSGVMAVVFAPEAWSDVTRAWFAAGMAISTGILLAIFLFIGSLVLAPIRLLHKADLQIERLQKSRDIPHLEVTVRRVRHITMDEIRNAESLNIIPPTTGISDTFFVIEATLQASMDMRIDRVEAIIDHLKVRAFNSPVERLRGTETHEFFFVMRMTEADTATSHLWVLANGNEWVSSTFPLDLSPATS